MATIATLQRMPASQLSATLLAQSPDSESGLAIIDVRDDDHIGGHIRGSTHVPSRTLDYRMPELVRKLQDKETVIFHCALSQQRGPTAALHYLRERERLLGKKGTVGDSMKRSAAEEKEHGSQHGKDDGWEDVSESKKEQQVFVLDRGFHGWQEVYGEDTRLTENYSKELWSED